MWANYPPSIRFSTMLFINENGGNVLDADVIRSMYRVRKDISNIKTEFGECVYLLKVQNQTKTDKVQNQTKTELFQRKFVYLLKCNDGKT